MKTGKFEANEDNLFEKFVSTTTIKYCYYKDTFKVLGNTFKMCVIQVRLLCYFDRNKPNYI